MNCHSPPHGRTIMTTEPKFIPNEAVEISLGDNAHLKVRMIDCVGYIVDSSLGYVEDNEPRMVTTPWFDHPIAFNEAAEIGTKKLFANIRLSVLLLRLTVRLRRLTETIMLTPKTEL